MAKFSYILVKLRQLLLTLIVLATFAFIMWSALVAIESGASPKVAAISIIAMLFCAIIIQVFFALVFGLRDFYNDAFKMGIGIMKTSIEMIRKIISLR